MQRLILVFLFSYLIGSISFAWLAARLKGIDLRKEGSGTLGARNVKRMVGKKEAFLVLALDILKGFLAVFVANQISSHSNSSMVGWLGVVCGHGWSLFLRFSGGKGLASSVGALLLISPLTLLSELLLGFFLFAFTRNVYIAAITMICLMPAILYFVSGHKWALPYAFLLSSLMLVLHWKNIKELIGGSKEGNR